MIHSHIFKQVDLHEIDRLEKAALRAALFLRKFWSDTFHRCENIHMSFQHGSIFTHIPIGSHRIHVWYILAYMVTWIPSIYPLYVSIYIPAPWILWDSNKNRESSFNQTSCVFKSTMTVPLTSRPNVVTGRSAR